MKYEVIITLLDNVEYKGIIEETDNGLSIVSEIDDNGSYESLFRDLEKGELWVEYPPIGESNSYHITRMPFTGVEGMFQHLIDSGFELTYKETK